ncbi:hypothetical protein [Nodosilinea sp. E11]|uniref:hypothetical protein n=1 Tax=Nodosilinea sp. E11 TaxID=3037479 RepID=UPI002934DB98|nr:hypothetical protein [Nodosilinea sp. E11]WOD39831.1 hypothetical protein RRF56_03365 [Nodosilinea sp. E11]
MKSARFASFLTVAMATAGVLASATSASAQAVLNEGVVTFSGNVEPFCVFSAPEPGTLDIDPGSARRLSSTVGIGQAARINVACNTEAANLSTDARNSTIPGSANNLLTTPTYNVGATLPAAVGSVIDGTMPVDLTVTSANIIPEGIYNYDVQLTVTVGDAGTGLVDDETTEPVTAL